MMSFIYLASPYSDRDSTVEAYRYQEAMRFCAEQMTSRPHIHIFSPIVYGHQMAKQYDLPGDAAWWQNFNLKFMNNCSQMWVLKLPGWDTSLGVTAEIEYARGRNLYTEYYNPSED